MKNNITKAMLKDQGSKILMFMAVIKKARQDKSPENLVQPLVLRCKELLNKFLVEIKTYKKQETIVADIEVERYKRGAEKTLKLL